MNLTTCFLSPILLLLVLEIVSFAQVPAANRANAKVAGRVIIKGQRAPGMQVLLKKRDGLDLGSGTTQSPAVTAITNADGQYQLTNLAAGAYLVSVYVPAYVIEGESRLSYEYGKTVTIAEGEQIENLDFSLMRGGVITGKVTDEYGKPVIAQGVGAFRLDQHGKRDNAAAFQMLGWQTDDRGVYRIFGLEPGRYVIGVGASSEDSLQPIGHRGSYRRTYHPDVVEESSAKIIKVTSGGEVENVDIKLSHATKGYTASGRVIDAETSKPLPGVTIGCEFAKTAGSKTDLVFSRSGNISPKLYRILREACERAGVPYGRGTPDGLVLHDARHTATTHLLESNVSPKTVQEWMGWSDKAFVLYYSHASKGSREQAG